MDKKTITYKRLGRCTSALLHPLAVPTYLASTLFFGPTVLRNIPMDVRLYCLEVMVLATLVIPLLGMTLLRSSSLWRALLEKKWVRRVVPAALALLCYVGCMNMLPQSMSLFMLHKVLLAAVGCALFVGIAGIFINLSPHMIAAGGTLAVLLLLDFAGFGRMTVPFCAAVMLAGALGSARMYLRHERPWQLAVGFFGGFIISAAAMLI